MTNDRVLSEPITREQEELNIINRRIELNELSKEQAQAEAEKQGFIFGKTSSLFDPMSISEWTPLQAVAFLVFDFEAVRSVSDEVRKRMVIWTHIVVPIFRRWKIALAGEATILDLPDEQKAKAGLKLLLNALREGKICATGIAAETKKRETIGAIDWQDLKLEGADTARSPAGLTYLRVALSRDDVLALVPKRLSDDEARALIRDAIENAGFIGQEKGAAIVRAVDPTYPKKRAMALVKELTGNEKPGPKGPRKNRADNRA